MDMSELQKLMVIQLNFRDRSEVHQCWDCDSEGEFYETVDDNLIDDGSF